MKNPILSVIISVYNCEKYIIFSLNSIFNQTFQDFQLIIINDGSTDNTWDIVKKLCEAYRGNVLLIDHNDNKGLFVRRSEAIDASNSKYIALQDGDDISFLYRFKKQVDFLEKNEHIFCCGGYAIRIDENNGYYYEDDEDNGIMNYPPNNHDEIVKMITKKCMNPIIDPSTMFRKSDFLELGGYSLRNDINLCDDFQLWLRFILSGKKFYNFQEPLIRYRMNNSGNTRKYKQKMIEQHMIVWREFMGKTKNV